jgi:hypothetical protein
MRAEVLMAVKMPMVVFWVVMPCGLVGGTNVMKNIKPKQGIKLYKPNTYSTNRTHTLP